MSEERAYLVYEKQLDSALPRERGERGIGVGRLFGTDGVRGVANRGLTPELAFRLGRAGAAVLTGKVAGEGEVTKRTKILVGRDTRISGPMLEAALVAGITSVGCDVLTVGVMPTPGVAYLTRALGADAGVVISASHNPVEDNGIKFFSGDGFKLPDEVEEEIEAQISSFGEEDGLPRPAGERVGRIMPLAEAARRYVDFLKKTIDVDLAGLRVVVDCAHGAASTVAPILWRELGAEVTILNAEPNGININVACGSTAPRFLQEEVRRRGAQLGIAHDGDADRVIAVDEEGEIVNGDHILAICGLALLRQGRLPGKTIAITAYSNLGLKQAMEAAGGQVIITKNGDRYVLEAMRERGLLLGGEQSGHIIFLNYTTTGDGLLTSLQLAAQMRRAGEPLSRLRAQMTDLPQVLENVRVARKEGWEENPAIVAAIARAEAQLEGRGRVFVRASGTEPLLRILLEGPERMELLTLARELAGVIGRELGT